MNQSPRRPAARAAGLILIAALAAFLVAAVAVPGPAAGGFHQAPPLSLPDLDGKKVQVNYSDARLTLVNFWATWCMPCLEEMPQIENLVEKYGESGFKAVGIVVESGEASVIRNFLARNLLATNYPILMGDDETSAAYGEIQIIPTTYLITSEGKVLKTHLGVTEDFEAAVSVEIEAYLAGPGARSEVPSRKKDDAGR